MLSDVPDASAVTYQDTYITVQNDNNIVDSVFQLLPNGKLLGKKNNEYFLLNKELQVISERYEDIYEDNYEEQRLFVKKDGKFGVIDFYEHILVPIQYDSIQKLSEGRYIVQIRDKYGVIDGSGEVRIPIKYDSIRITAEGSFDVDLNGKHGIMNGKGMLIIGHLYDWITPISDSLYIMKQDGFYGIIDGKGNKMLMVNERYDSFRELAPGKAILVQKGSYYGVISREGKQILPVEYDSISLLDHGYYMVEKKNKHGVITTAQNEVLPIIYDYVELLPFGNYKVMLGTKCGIVDEGGWVIVPVAYDEINVIDNGNLYVVYKDGLYGMYDRRENVILPLEYGNISWLSTFNYYIVTLDGKTGVIGNDAKEIIPIAFDGLQYLKDGFYAWKNGKQGKIDLAGNVDIAFTYDELVKDVTGGYIIKNNGKYGMIDHRGLLILKAEYDMISEVSYEGLFIVQKDKKFGTVNIYGNNVIPVQYDNITYDNNLELFVVTKQGKSGVMNSGGMLVLDIKYEDLRLLSINSASLGQGKPVTGKTTFAMGQSMVNWNMVKIKSDCNLYKKDNIVDGIHTKLKTNMEVEWIADTYTGWSKVLYNGKIGYVKNSSLLMAKLSSYQTTVVTKSVVFRSKPEVDSKNAITTISLGTKITIISDLGNWLQIRYSGRDGYIVKSKTLLGR
jgi:hypothetical protein